MRQISLLLSLVLTIATFLGTNAFAPLAVNSFTLQQSPTFLDARKARKISDNEVQNRKISNTRRKQLGIAEYEDEYDLDIALDSSTDPFITKVIAGSLILSIAALLVAGVIIPATADYGEGVCNPILTNGRC